MAKSNLIWGAAVALVAACEPPPQAPVVELELSSDSLMLESGALTHGAWLGDQRWAVVSPDDAAVWLIDFADGTTRQIGTTGDEYRNPFSLFSHRDTLYVNDWAMARTTVWDREGRWLAATSGGTEFRGALPSARDDGGNFYLAPRPPAGPDGSGNRDSTAVVRVAERWTSADTVAWLAPWDMAEVSGDAGRRFERRVFSGEDAWGVLPDGSLWIARVKHNRVHWFDSSGQRVARGPMLPDPVYPVSRLDRDVFIQNYPPALQSTAERLPFAEIKPPFVAGLTGADGSIWLRKSRELTDTVQVYHVVDRAGELDRLVVIPLIGAVMAANENHLLVAEGLERGVRLWQLENTFPVESDTTGD